MAQKTIIAKAEPRELTVFFDGLCRICAHEISWYQRLDRANRIQWLDISASSFNAEAYGFSQSDLMREIHGLAANGVVLKGVDTFIAIWSLLPNSAWAARIASNAPINFLLRIGYQIFVRIRPYLPRKQNEVCENDRCQRR